MIQGNLEIPALAAGSQAGFRPIHYLGSKLRILQGVTGAIDAIDPDGGPVCDLFAGSGVVAHALAVRRNVVAVDIQEYSRTVCSAVLDPSAEPNAVLEELWEKASQSEQRAQLCRALKWMIQAEDSSIREAADGEPEALCDLLEAGPLLQTEGVEVIAGPIREVMARTQERLREAGLLDSRDSMVSRYFGGIYFGYQQAADLDALLGQAWMLPAAPRRFALAAIVSTASEIVNTVGKHFAQPLRPRYADGRPKPNLWKKVSADRGIDVGRTYIRWVERYREARAQVRRGNAVRSDYRDFLREWPGEISVVYADPPYTRDHYSRFYHVLETICLRDNPGISRSNLNEGRRLSRGVYREARHQSPFCIKSKVAAAFDELAKLVSSRGASLVLSYSPHDSDARVRPRLLTVDAVRSILSSHFGATEVVSPGDIAHSKLNGKSRLLDKPEEAELLLVCRC